MEHDGVGDMEVDVNSLSDIELAQKLQQLGANIGPITDSTRAVYQRKLQRWLQYGPTTDTSILESSPVEPHVNTASWPETVAVTEVSTSRSSRSNNIDASARNGPASSPTKTGSTKAVDASTMVDTHEKHDTLSIRMSRSEVISCIQPYSHTFAECGTESFKETPNGLSDAKRLMKPKAKPIKNVEPVVTLDDIEIVDRAVASSSINSSSPLLASSYASTVKGKDEEGPVRRRYSTYNVSSRPSLHEYKNPDAYDGPSYLPDLDDYRILMSDGRRGRQSTSFSSPAQAIPAEDTSPAEPWHYCDTKKLVWCLVIVAVLLFIGAVICNMEPAFTNPLMSLPSRL